jgi:hypothetical protein
MEDKSYLAIESALARLDRTNRRLFILCIILILLLLATNIGWLYWENQFEDVVTTIEAQQGGNGTNTVIGGDYYEPNIENDH